MLFDVEEDSGHRIVGYLVPDSYSVGSTISVTSNGQEIVVLKANEARSSVVVAGRHGTGDCGFVLTDENVPNLSAMPYLEIRDAESGLIIYRRRPASSVVQCKLFRLETHSMRSRQMDHALGEHFQMSFPDVDRYGRETTTQTFLLRCCGSIYITARLLNKEYEFAMDSSFRKICILQDPYIEFAETLLALRPTNDDNVAELNFREKLSLESTADYVASFDVMDPRALNRGLLRMPEVVVTTLSNPLARSLAARTSDETPNSTYVSGSLESLASFDIVGIRERPETFLDPLAELLNIDRNVVPYTAPSNDVVQLANGLRTLPAANALLDMDLEIFAAVCSAVDKSF